MTWQNVLDLYDKIIHGCEWSLLSLKQLCMLAVLLRFLTYCMTAYRILHRKTWTGMPGKLRHITAACILCDIPSMGCRQMSGPFFYHLPHTLERPCNLVMTRTWMSTSLLWQLTKCWATLHEVHNKMQHVGNCGEFIKRWPSRFWWNQSVLLRATLNSLADYAKTVLHLVNICIMRTWILHNSRITYAFIHCSVYGIQFRVWWLAVFCVCRPTVF